MHRFWASTDAMHYSHFNCSCLKSISSWIPWIPPYRLYLKAPSLGRLLFFLAWWVWVQFFTHVSYILYLLQAAPESRSNKNAAVRRKCLHDVQVRKADTKAQKAALLKQLDELELGAQSLKQERDGPLNLPNNFIDRLPDELLMGIFQEYVYLGSLPETLLLVSRHWFHTAVGVKSLWVDLEIPLHDQTPERASRSIHRRLLLSDPAPIEVHYDSLPVIWDRLRGGRWFPTPVIVGENGRHCQRIRQLTIGHREYLAFLEWPLPNLQQLTYGPTDYYPVAILELKRWEHGLKASKMPNLHTLHIRYLTLSNPPSIFSNIRKLRLLTCSLVYSPNDFQSYIAAATHLRTLEMLAVAIYPPNGQRVDPAFLIHPKIRTLRYFDQSTAPGRCLLGRLDVPAADALNITMHDLECIASLAQGLFDQLFRLRIGTFSKDSRTSQQGLVLVELLGQARKLEKLTLTAECSTHALKFMDALEADDSLCPKLRTFTVSPVNVLDRVNNEALENRIRDRYNRLHRL